MSRPDRPFRATYVHKTHTVHFDYATKEERSASSTATTLTTVTSRKPLKPGTPVCWVNVYAEGHPASHRTKAFADSAASTATLPRLHCIPVYLPGEGAEPACTSECDTLRAEVQDWASRFKQAQAEVERLTKERDIAIRVQSDMITDRNHWREIAEGVGRERDAAQSKLAAAQAQAMPAGKVVYGASGKFGINRDFQTIEFADKRLRDTYRKTDGWTWFTRVEES